MICPVLPTPTYHPNAIVMSSNGAQSARFPREGFYRLTKDLGDGAIDINIDKRIWDLFFLSIKTPHCAATS